MDRKSQVGSVSLALAAHRFAARRRHRTGYGSSSRLALRADGGAIVTTDPTVTVHN
jgi:hypothetical protein